MMLSPPATSHLVTCSVHNRVATITLNRPEARNALNRQMREDLGELLRWCSEQKDLIRAVVLAGNGEAFCAGQDLKERGDVDSPVESLQSKRRGDFQTLLADLPQPTIAAVHGYVLGRGLELALTCDLRIAAEDARIGLPEVRLGMIPASGGTQRLARVVGPARALHLILTAEYLDAQTALQWGLVTKVTPRNELTAAAQAMGERLAEHAPLAMRYARWAVLEGSATTLEQGLRLEAALAALLRTTSDREEGIRAFREKRPPQFTGR